MKTKHTKSAGGIVLNSSGKVLVVSQHGRSWSLPKGHIDSGEEALKAAKREIYEESGVKNVEFVKALGSYKRYKLNREGLNDYSEMKHISMFLFKTDQEKLKPIDPHNPEAIWVDKEKVADVLTIPKDKKFFLKVIGELA